MTNKPLILSDNAQLNRLLEMIINWQRNERISLDVGFPQYMLEYIAKEIEPNTKQRNILIKKLTNLEKFTRLSSGNVYMEE